jgi:hypothetical protein
MDTLALGVIAIGVVAAIGVVLVAMNGNDSEAKAPPDAAPMDAAKQQLEQPRPRPRARRRQQAVPKYVVAAPQANGYTSGPQDPLVSGFMQVVSSELQSLRQQQEKIDQRLKLINGIAELMHDMQPGSANGTTQLSSNSNHRTAA